MQNKPPDDFKQGLYRFLFDQGQDPTIVFNAEGRIRMMNHAARRLSRELVERLFARDAPCALELALFRDEIATLGRSEAEIQVDGRSLSIRGMACEGEHIAILRDVTETRRIEAELRSLQRVESVGHLTASLVHDFNNLLTPIACLSSCLEEDLPEDGKAGEMARDIRIAAERATGLARQVLK
jgi:nitrogen-specific signal transduction histidine kinase